MAPIAAIQYNPPTLPLGERNLHFLHVSQLKCFNIFQGNACRHFSLMSLFLPTLYIFCIAAFVVSNVFLLDYDPEIKLNESESQQRAVHSISDDVQQLRCLILQVHI